MKPSKAEEALIFEDVVLPMLERRCQACHGQGKRKGGLVVTTYGNLMKGGKNGVVIIPGKPAESELFRRITLDPGNEDFMPTDGKTPLTKTETEVIRWWIEKAKAAPEKKLSDVTGHETILPVIASVLGLPGGSPLAGTELTGQGTVNPSIPATTSMASVESLRKKGVTVRVMLHSPVMLDITLPARSGIAMTDIEKDLGAVARNVIWLNLSDNGLTDDDLAILKQMTNMEKLRLEKNPVTDKVNDLLADLRHLEAVNLNETHLSDSGLARLKQHPSLKRIYSWRAVPATP